MIRLTEVIFNKRIEALGQTLSTLSKCDEFRVQPLWSGLQAYETGQDSRRGSARKCY